MKLTLALLCLLMISCGDNKRKTYTENSAATDTEKVVAVVEEKQDFSKLADLKTETNIEALLCQNWEMEDDLEALKGSSGDEETQRPLVFRDFNFSPDNTYTRNLRSHIEFGNWSYNDASKTLSLRNEENEKSVYKIRAIAADELKLTSLEGQSITILKYVSAAVRHQRNSDDPLFGANNRWRIAPKTAESDASIRKRLKDCVHFFVLYYNDAIAKNSQTISFYGFPSCLKFYGPGIYIQKKDKLHEDWIECFYNEDQAMKAYKIMDSVIGLSYKWPEGSGTNWLQKNAAVLMQMESKL